jgi:hypothetical protein
MIIRYFSNKDILNYNSLVGIFVTLKIDFLNLLCPDCYPGEPIHTLQGFIIVPVIALADLGLAYIEFINQSTKLKTIYSKY